MDLFSLDGKVALATGAGSGLGRQFRYTDTTYAPGG
jgi:hypothetical protein